MEEKMKEAIVSLIAIALALIGFGIGVNNTVATHLYLPISDCDLSTDGQTLSFNFGDQTAAVTLNEAHQRPANFQDCTGLRTTSNGILVVLKENAVIFTAPGFNPDSFTFTDK